MFGSNKIKGPKQDTVISVYWDPF